MKKALLVVDVQNGVYVDGDRTAFAGAAMIAVINGLTARARRSRSPIVFIRHEDNETLVHDSAPWQLVAGLDVLAEDLFVEKRHGSAFHDTPLRDQLLSLGIQGVVICGMQTEYCIDSTVRHAFTLGFAVELAQDGHTTFDSVTLSARQIVDHHNRVLESYGSVLPAESIVFSSDVS